MEREGWRWAGGQMEKSATEEGRNEQGRYHGRRERMEEGWTERRDGRQVGRSREGSGGRKGGSEHEGGKGGGVRKINTINLANHTYI